MDAKVNEILQIVQTLSAGNDKLINKVGTLSSKVDAINVTETLIEIQNMHEQVKIIAESQGDLIQNLQLLLLNATQLSLVQRPDNDTSSNDVGLQVLECLKESGGMNIQSKSIEGNTALHYAAKHGNSAVVSYLIEKGAKINETNNFGRSPLLTASFYGHVDTMKILLEFFANVEQAEEDGFRPLQIATQEGHLDAVKLLVEIGRANIHARTNGQTALSIATRNRHNDIVRYLKSKGANKFLG